MCVCVYTHVGRGGGKSDPRDVTKDNREAVMQINSTSQFLLTAELMPLLKASPAARIVSQSRCVLAQRRLPVCTIQNSPFGGEEGRRAERTWMKLGEGEEDEGGREGGREDDEGGVEDEREGGRVVRMRGWKVKRGRNFSSRCILTPPQWCEVRGKQAKGRRH